ncbi:hypothetical protein KUCAC02_002685, partial [Chaenocephalus aceratus]
KRMVEVCDAKRVPRYLPPSRLVEAFGRTTATSACAMVTKRQPHTHPLYWASPASLRPLLVVQPDSDILRCPSLAPCPLPADFAGTTETYLRTQIVPELKLKPV